MVGLIVLAVAMLLSIAWIHLGGIEYIKEDLLDEDDKKDIQ